MALAIPMQSNAMNLNDSTIVVENVAASRSAFLINRMNEIRMMDKSTLNSLEKKELRIEKQKIVKSIEGNWRKKLKKL